MWRFVLCSVFLSVSVLPGISTAQDVEQAASWVPGDAEFVVHVDDVSQLIGRFEQFPLFQSETFQSAVDLLTEEPEPILNLGNFEELLGCLKNTSETLELGPLLVSINHSNTSQFNWVAMVRVKSDVTKKDLEVIWHQNVATISSDELSTEEVFRVFGIDLQSIVWELHDSWLVASNDQTSLSESISQMTAPEVHFQSLAENRRFQTVFRRLVKFDSSDGRLSIFFDPKSVINYMRLFGVDPNTLKIVKGLGNFNELLMAGVQIRLFENTAEEADASDSGELAPLVGLAGYLAIGAPRTGLHAAFDQPIEAILPVHNNTVGLFALRANLPEVFDAVEEYFDNTYGKGATAKWLQKAGLPEGFCETVLPLTDGTVISNMYKSEARGDWATIQSIHANDEQQAETLVKEIAAIWGEKNGVQDEVLGNSALIFNGQVALVEVENWIFFELKEVLTEYLEQFAPPFDSRLDLGVYVEQVRRHLEHMQEPFFAMALSPDFWHRWTRELNSARERKLEDQELSRSEKLEIAKARIQMAFWELVGYQVIIASSDEKGIHVSGVVFQPEK
ncbi:MAG: hypothetical protein R3C03_19555 [Pirellulaceae bacterium]